MLCAIVLTILWLAAALPAAELRLVFTGDLHGNLDGLAALAPVIRQVPEPVLRLDLGDTTQGGFAASLAGGRPMFTALNALGFDLWVPGNHDFDAGAESLSKSVRWFAGATLGADWSAPGIPNRPWILLERGGVRCAIIGLTDPREPDRQLPDSGVAFTDPDSAVADAMPEILAARPDLIVLAWHCGPYYRGGTLAGFLRRHPEIDLVLGAHTHEERPGERLGRALLVQTGHRAAAAGVITVRIDDDTRKIVRIESELRRPFPGRPDPELALLADTLRRSGAADRIVGRHPGGLAAPDEPGYGAPLAVFAAEALRDAAGTPAALAAVNCGGVKTGENITAAELFRLFPYENRLAAVRLRNDELRQAVMELRRRRTAAALIGPGIICRFDRRGRLTGFECPPITEVAISEYLLTSLPCLRPAIDSGRFRRIPQTERSAVASRLAAALPR